MKNTLLLYSVNTLLAYIVTETYYKNNHYVWCSPYFDCRCLDSIHRRNPPSSNPCAIYWGYMADIEANDLHSALIDRNRIGIIKGAGIKKAEGIIDEAQEKDIISMVNAAGVNEFKPLLYIIPVEKVLKICKPAEISIKANPLSKEYIIESLPREFFDIIELGGK